MFMYGTELYKFDIYEQRCVLYWLKL